MNIVLLGAPGSGKGFISNYIIDNYGFEHISTGNLLRESIKNKTKLGEKVQSYMTAGELVPDELVLSVLKDALNNKKNYKGLIFDGYPRKIAQAEELEKLVNIDLVICVDVPQAVILDRLSSRRVCSSCSEVYSLKLNKDTKCLKCGGEVIQRSDDVPSVIQHRLDKYEEQTKPLIDFYRNQNKLIMLDNSGSSEQTFSALKGILDKELEKK